MQPIHDITEVLPEKSVNYLVKVVDPSGHKGFTWIVSKYDVESNKWDNKLDPVAWTRYPLDRDDVRFG